MRLQGQFKTILGAMLVVALLAGTLLAQEGVPPQDATMAPSPDQQGQVQGQDPPGRVARLQYMSGEVSLQPGGVNDWVEGALNRPLTTADRVWTDKNSRAELSLGSGAIRLNSETSLTLTNVSDNTVQLELDQGTLNLSVYRLFPGEIYEIDTPNMAFTIMKAGVYRFDVLPDADQTWVTVRKGYGEATGQAKAVRVNSGEQVRFTSGNSLQHTAQSAPPPDGFEDWARIRDKREENSVSARYVAPGVIGSADLDEYGGWQVAPAYGPVWYPRAVPVGWAPYHYGHWAYVAPWGWTWVDDAPWGFAPFHYGRWVFWGGAWGWCPGPVAYVGRPVWAPALVAWVGGPRFGVGLSFGVGGGVAWFPLGYGEPFVPWYHAGYGYFRGVNVSNTTITNVNITNVYNNRTQINNVQYANQNVAGAVTAVPKSAFASGQPVAKSAVQVPHSAMQQAQVVGAVQATPTKASVLGGHTPLSKGVPPATAFSKSVVTHNPPPPRPASFEAKQSVGGAGNTHVSGNAGAPGNAAAAGGNVPRPPSNGGPQTGGRVFTNDSIPKGGTTSSTNAAGTARNVPRPPDQVNSRSGLPNVSSTTAGSSGTALTTKASTGMTNTGTANTGVSNNTMVANRNATQGPIAQGPAPDVRRAPTNQAPPAKQKKPAPSKKATAPHPEEGHR